MPTTAPTERTPASRWGALSTFAPALIATACIAVSGCDAFVDTETRIERARAHLGEGSYRAAMAELKTALQSEPEHVQGRILLAELSMLLGDLESAEKDIGRALAAGAPPEQVSAVRYEMLLAQRRFDELRSLLAQDQATAPVRRLVLEARIHGSLGEYAEAEQRLDAALKQAPSDPEALLERARLDVVRGDTQSAMQLPERVSQHEEIHAQALSLRGSVQMLRGAYADARDSFLSAQEIGRKRLPIPEKLTLAARLVEANLALEDADAAEQSFGPLTSWAPDSVITHYLRARIAMLRNDPIAAVTEGQKALRVDPKHMQSQLLLAAAHLSQSSFEQAQDVLDRLLAANPDNLAARKLLAQVHLGRGDPDKAQSVLRATADAVVDPQVDWLMGAALLQSGSGETALQHLERSLAATPGNTQRRIELAGAYIAARMPDKAVEILKAIPPESASAQRARVLLVLATAAGKAPAVARREIEELVARHGEDVTILSAAGAWLVARGEIERSRQWLERAVALDPKAVGARISLARIEIRRRNHAAAKSHLQQVVKIDPRHQVARLGLSELAWSTGDRDQARQWLEDAISVDPSAVDARLRLAQISFIEGNASRGRDLLGQAIRVGEDRKAALNGAGQVLARAGMADEALARFREAAAAGLPEAVLNAARLQLELDRPDEARAMLQSALVDKPGWRAAELMFIQVDARDGKVDRAIARARSSAGDASPAAVRELEGDIYLLAKRPAEAVAAYEDAQQREPRGALAIKIFNARRLARAAPVERSLLQWLKQSPADAEVRRVLAAFYETSGQRDQAAVEYERLLAENRIDPAMLNNLAWTLHERGDARALDLARRAHAAAPNVPAIADTYGWILVQTGNIAEGLNVLEMALAGAPGHPDIQYHAAAAYARSGRAARAAELLRASLQSTGEFASRDAAQALLRSVSSEAPMKPAQESE